MAEIIGIKTPTADYFKAGDDVLEAVAELTNSGCAVIARVVGSRWIIVAIRDAANLGLHGGMELPLVATFCNAVVKSGHAVAIDGFYENSNYLHHPLRLDYQIESYIGVPISLANGEIFGTLCAFDKSPRELANPAILLVFKAFAKLLATQLEDFRIHPVTIVDETKDVSERKMIEDIMNRQANLIDLSFEPILVWHPLRGIIEWNKGAEHVYGYSRAEAIGQSSHALLRTIHPVPLSELTKTLNETKRWAGELQQYTKDGRKLNVESRQQVIEADGETLVLETSHNISERIEWEARQKLMSRELAHRVKNSFAVLQAILRSTLKSSPDPHEFAAAFSGRLHSLAAAQDVLTTGDWKGAELGALIKSQLSYYVVDGSKQLIISGPLVNLAAEHAAPCGLIINELATNALKFGALSVPDGEVSLTWQLLPMDDDKFGLTVTWQETGGPPITSIGRRSYGSTLIERSLAGAKVVSAFEPEGLVCVIEIELGSDIKPLHTVKNRP